MNALKIGIVEDDAIIAQSIIEMLTASGYSVTKPAKRYSEAIAMIEEEMPDLLLLDVKILGKMDGIEVARTVRKAFDIPYIFLTANTDFETISRAKEVAPAAFLAKPVTRAQLHAAIEIALAGFAASAESNNNIASAPQVTEAAGIFVKQGAAFRRLLFSDVLFAESRDNYLRLVIGNGEEAMIRSTLAGFMERVPGMVQTHRSFAIAPKSVTEVFGDELRIGIHKIPISKTYRPALIQALGIR